MHFRIMGLSVHSKCFFLWTGVKFKKKPKSPRYSWACFFVGIFYSSFISSHVERVKGYLMKFKLWSTYNLLALWTASDNINMCCTFQNLLQKLCVTICWMSPLDIEIVWMAYVLIVRLQNINNSLWAWLCSLSTACTFE